jgi:putative transposase
MFITEKHHRLPRIDYRGEVSVSFTLCLKDRFPLFKSTSIIDIFEKFLRYEVEQSDCIIPVYCFMPDHQHLVVTGINPDSDTLNLINRYKQRTGYWLAQNQVNASWQKDFFDHVLRKDEGLVNVARYILENPVRRGLVANWQDYPFKGAIGCDLNYILDSMV